MLARLVSERLSLDIDPLVIDVTSKLFYWNIFRHFRCLCLLTLFFHFFRAQTANWEARRMCCHNVIWSRLVMLEFMTCSAPLQTWKMLTRGFFATQEQASTNHKVYCIRLSPVSKKKRDQVFSESHSHFDIFCRHTPFSLLFRRQENVFCADDRSLSLWSAALCSPGTAGSDNLPGPAEISCCSRFLKLNNHRVQS